MKLKHYSLWALALAFAAVSCSDDLDNPGKGNENPNGNGSSTYMKVTVNTGVVTRADPPASDIPPTGGEDGDGHEVGKVNEYIVSDVTVILYKNESGSGGNNTLTEPEFKESSKIVGAGYAKTSGSMNPGDGNLHNKSVTVLVTATDDEDFDKNTYGVITVTNWRDNSLAETIKSTTDITATKLANLLVDKIHHTVEGLQRDFIMSSHMKDGETVTLDANATESNAPEVKVHVERLAAKVRIKPVENKPEIENYIYPIKRTDDEGTEETIAQVRLDNVALVNKLTSGSYLLKRVTLETTSNDISALTEGDDSWLGDETMKKEAIPGAGYVYPGTNYVIDPWTRNKTQQPSTITDYSNIAAENDPKGAPFMLTATDPVPGLKYSNVFKGASFDALWGTLDNTRMLNANPQNNDPNDTSILIDYTMENTTSVTYSKNGYSTGALFKATYFPLKWNAVADKEDGTGKEVRPIDVIYDDLTEGKITSKTKGKNFLVYQSNVYQNFEAIFNEFVWNRQATLGPQTKIYGYDDFKTANIGGIKISEFENSAFYQGTDSDPMGYIRYLRARIATYKQGNYNENTTFSASDNIDDYLAATNQAEHVYANVKEYKDGVTYYPYWIRHANNGKPTEMGIMEFGIVRNNIYDMVVTDISGLGLSGTDEPDPDKDDETKEYRFNVIIYVKDWVIRDNGDIIL